MTAAMKLLGAAAVVLACWAQTNEAATDPLRGTPPRKMVASVDVNPDTLRLQVGDVGRATCVPRNGYGTVLTNVCTWLSRNTAVATTSTSTQNASVTALKAGATWEVATVKTKRDSTRVVVTDTGTPPPAATVASVSVAPTAVTLDTGASRQFTASTRLSDGTTRPFAGTWTATGGTISSTGLYKVGGYSGDFTVTATEAGKLASAAIDVPVVTVLPHTVALSGLAARATLQGHVRDPVTGPISPVPTWTWIVRNSAVIQSIGSTKSAVTLVPLANGSSQVVGLAAGDSDSSLVTVTGVTPPTTALIFEDNFANFALWEVNHTCCSYSRTITTSNPTPREGTNAFRLELRRTDPQVAGSNRAEISQPTENANWTGHQYGPFGVGDEVWIGFSVYLPTTWINDTDLNEEIAMQVHPVEDACDPAQTPIISLSIQHDEFYAISKSDPLACSTSSGAETDFWSLGLLTKGVWNDFVYHMKLSLSTDGVLQVWRNGTLVVDNTGRNTFNNTSPGYLKLGINKFGGWASVNVPERILWYDNMRIAKTGGSYALVAPGQ